MQGEELSLILFNLYVNDFEINFLNSECVPFEISSLNLFFLMYADDMVIFLWTIAGLQSLLDQLSYYFSTWKLHINVDKSKIVAFRKGGMVNESEKMVYLW